MNKLLRFLFSRVFLVSASILVQAFVLVLVVWRFGNYFVYFYGLFILLSILAVIWIVSDRTNPAYKLAWIIPIMLFPIFGGLFYILLGRNKTSRTSKEKMKKILTIMKHNLTPNESIILEIQNENKTIANQARYIQNFSYCPVFKNTATEYLSPGERKFESLKEALLKAEKYIFLEYFIVSEGIMWDSILDILIQKVEEGIDVRVIYDDFGCLLTLPSGYDKYLESLGIKCCVFNPLIPILSLRFNNRDHRKIAIIDGHTAFTGGINIGDEYINAYEKYGYWKDASIKLQGEGVWSLTIMFLSLWNYLRKIDNEDCAYYRPIITPNEFLLNKGYVQPFTDSPLDDESVGETVYLNLINNATDYVYINTPYLVLNNEMITALIAAAKRSVDIRIVTPYMPDKWYVHAVTRSNYSVLVDNGVKIYEFLPGFMHSKTFVVDDQLAVVGTINLDYRSLYLHFECGVWMYKTSSVMDVKEDFLKVLRQCKEITPMECNSVKWYRRFGRSILKLFAQLM